MERRHILLQERLTDGVLIGIDEARYNLDTLIMPWEASICALMALTAANLCFKLNLCYMPHNLPSTEGSKRLATIEWFQMSGSH